MAVVTTNLATQVQNRINNLTGTETLEQLLVLRKAADNLSLSLTAIETAISAKIAALDNTSPDDDLLIANRAASIQSNSAVQSVIKSIQRGTAGGSGSTLSITIATINPSKSVLIANHAGAGYSSISGSPQARMRIVNSNTIEFLSSGTNTIQMAWEVVEYV